MNGKFLIHDSKRKNLIRIAKELGLTQRDLAEALQVSPAAISKYLAIGPNYKALGPDKIQQLVIALKARALLCREILNSKENQAHWEMTVIDHARSSLSVKALRDLEVEIEDLTTADVTEIKIIDQVLASPGGALSVNASNYVERTADREIDDILIAGRSPSSIIIAPINGGTSSFLNRLHQKAQSLSNSWVCIVHFETAFPDGEKFTQLELFRYLFRKIGRFDEAKLNGLDVIGMKDVFDQWAHDAWKEASRVVLIIDGLDQVFKNAGSIADALALVNWLSALRLEIALGKAPYDKLVLFVALTGKTWSAAHASPYASQASRLSLRKFTFKEVAEVFAKLGVVGEESMTKSAFELFYGHPYLTHLFGWSIRNGATQSEAEQAALTLDGPYESHWERIKSEIKFSIGTNYSLSEVLAVVADKTRGRSQNEKGDSIWRAYSRDLRVFGVVDGTANEPTICRFYRNAILNEQMQTPHETNLSKPGV